MNGVIPISRHFQHFLSNFAWFNKPLPEGFCSLLLPKKLTLLRSNGIFNHLSQIIFKSRWIHVYSRELLSSVNNKSGLKIFPFLSILILVVKILEYQYSCTLTRFIWRLWTKMLASTSKNWFSLSYQKCVPTWAFSHAILSTFLKI